jgi:hypothetical protein
MVFIFVGVIRDVGGDRYSTSETRGAVGSSTTSVSGDLAAIAVLGLLMLVLTFGIVALANGLSSAVRAACLRRERGFL